MPLNQSMSVPHAIPKSQDLWTFQQDSYVYIKTDLESITLSRGRAVFDRVKLYL